MCSSLYQLSEHHHRRRRQDLHPMPLPKARPLIRTFVEPEREAYL